MTREEAIIELKKKITCTIGGLSKEEYNATVMAIEALHQKGAYEQTKWERDVALQTLEEHGIGLGQKAEYIIPNGDVMFTSAAVRCKDCRWWNSETKGCKRNPSVEAWHETDFCKYGERQCNYFGERREE